MPARMTSLLPLLAGCRAIFGIDTPTHAVDGHELDAPIDMFGNDAVDASTTWGTPDAQFAGGDDDDPTLPSDMLEMYFNRNTDIYVTTRADLASAWATPTLVTQLSSASAETTPEISYDGLTIWFASDRTG